ncbi:MAG: succinate dehydrogenase cytochrome b subunit [Chthoniobacterales bacterium]
MATTTANPTNRRPVNPLIAWLLSSIGKKTVVAVTGLALVGFVIGHMGGNLTFFFGPDAINSYAMHLMDLGIFLWIIRLALLAIVTLHIVFTMLVWKENHAARPAKYEVRSRVQASIFSRTMRLTGIILLAFIIFHIAHFTAKVIYPSYNDLYTTLPDGHEVRDVYAMMVIGFSHPLVAAFYVLSMALLAFHLSHGISSLFQTLGLANRRLLPAFQTVGRVLAWTLFVGFAAIPISVGLFGVGKSYVDQKHPAAPLETDAAAKQLSQRQTP